ncbi:helix-turn-helix transcriptional regulator [Yinghuangia soli]|uniref:AraC family transcriptional regulator n=1 Tax=Yinghuangia soli TaxID=2908204 RepID=A0AA41U1A4_9ACTN|nr:AraC family transcriptional regulator [Yinghuangia soli]MCF2527327.1 AraC family transcriptional regulator [Yinghuangia soli]
MDWRGGTLLGWDRHGAYSRAEHVPPARPGLPPIPRNAQGRAQVREQLGDTPAMVGTLAEAPGIKVMEQACFIDHRGFMAAFDNPLPTVQLYLLRSGGFLRRSRGQEEFIDPTVGFAMGHGQEMSIAHPAGTCDISTCITLDLDTYADWVDQTQVDTTPAFPVPARLDLGHRVLTAACRSGADRFETTEAVHALLRQITTHRPPDGLDRRPDTVRAHRMLVAEVRAALLDDPSAPTLTDLARHAGCSPFHLSRVFRQVTGNTLGCYRNQLRTRSVLEHLADGADNLADLAAAHGFSDHAHLTRTLRRHLDTTPSELRERLRHTLPVPAPAIAPPSGT